MSISTFLIGLAYLHCTRGAVLTQMVKALSLQDAISVDMSAEPGSVPPAGVSLR